MRKITFEKLAILIVVLFLIITFAVKVINNGNSSVDVSSVDVDCKKCYYNQLENGIEKDIYTKVENIEDFEIDDEDSKSKCVTFYVRVYSIDRDFLSLYNAEEISRCVARAIQAVGYDMPLKAYFFHRYSIGMSECAILGLPLFRELEIKLDVADDYSEKTKEWYDQQIIYKMDNIPVNIDKSATIPDKITEIHKYVVDTLDYDHDNWNININPPPGLDDNKLCNIANRISSVYNALVGDHRVVCEGYAKMFKVLCDKYDIPCIIVASDEIAGEDCGHMWNYVYINNWWYIVDCTWDDKEDVVGTKYLMSGADEYHQPSNKMNFKVPALSSINYDEMKLFLNQHPKKQEKHSCIGIQTAKINHLTFVHPLIPT